MAKRIGDLLLAAGVVDRAGLDAALGHQKGSGLRLASACLDLGLASEEDLARVLSRQLGVPFVVLALSRIPAQTTARLPAPLAKALTALPVLDTGSELVVAMADPFDVFVTSEVVMATGAKLVEHGALIGPLQKALDVCNRGSERDWVGKLAGSTGTLGLKVVSGRGPLKSPEPEPDWSAEPGEPSTEGLVPADGQVDSDQGGPVTVMLVEDDPSTHSMLTTFLSKSGYRVMGANDGRAAMQLVRNRLPHAFLLDAMLPGIHGFDICRMLKHAEATRHIPVIMISAIHKGKETAEDVKLTHGANAYLEKPLRLKELARVLQNCLAGRKPPPSRRELATRLAEQLQKVTEALGRGDDEMAILALQDGLQVAPFMATLHYRLARLYLKQTKRYQAIDHLEWTNQLQPNQPTRYLLAQTYERIGLIQKAIAAWKEVLAAAREDEEIAKIRAHLEELQKQIG